MLKGSTKASRLLLLGLVLSPVVLMAQKKEELQSIQRDVATLDDHVKELQKSVDARMAALQNMLQQAVDASNKTAQSLATYERDAAPKMSDQQGKLATLGSKVDQMSDDFRSLSTNMAELLRRFNKLDSTLADISNAIRTLNSPPPTPAPAPGQTAAGPPGPPAGMSAETSFQNAYRDYMGGKDELALQEFADFLKYYDKTENAPSAQYYIGMIYYRGGSNYDDAVKAFDAVLEKYPENPRTQESLYTKALALLKGSRRTEAGRVFQEYLRRYPQGDHVANAHQNLKSLGLEPARTGKKRE